MAQFLFVRFWSCARLTLHSTGYQPSQLLLIFIFLATLHVLIFLWVVTR